MNAVVTDSSVVLELDYDKEAPVSLVKLDDVDGLAHYLFSYRSDEPGIPEPVTVKWKIPARRVKGVWRNTVDFNKRIQADWEEEDQRSRISIDSPVIGMFDHLDQNVLTFACSNAINLIMLGAKYREEDDCYYCHLSFFSECKYPITNFETQIRIDLRTKQLSRVLGDVSQWWEDFDMRPMPVPEVARKPLYSTWYQFHQRLDPTTLVTECKLAKELGYEAIIIDDGWQTKDNNRGYDFTGDWQPERLSDMSGLVRDIQRVGIKVGLWFSVPFCGVKSQAYQKFKGKFLTENHRWAPVFDPRYPEVREHLVNIYRHAVDEWGLDGLKLDFIDDFQAYPETQFGDDPARDHQSINDAVNTLLTEVREAVTAIRPDIFIEFRQRYVGPAIRKFGNILRAFDCPGDATMNRVRIADIRQLAGNTVVHSDMITWNFQCSVEDASLHMLSTLFGVPQLSVLLEDIPGDQLEMIRFYTRYWRYRSDVLLNGEFIAMRPLSNYPMLQSTLDQVSIIGLYEDLVVPLGQKFKEIDVLNAKMTNQIVLDTFQDIGHFEYTILDCMGITVSSGLTEIKRGCNSWQVPVGGMVTFTEAP